MDYDWPTSETLYDYFLGPLGPAWGFEDETTKLLEQAVESVIQNLEGLANARAVKIYETLETHKKLWKWTVDWCYCKQALSDVPNAVERFLKLTPILAGKTPNNEVNTYLREATRCYLWGFFQASIVLSRAAVEAGLNEHLEKRLSVRPSVDLVDKIHNAVRFKFCTTESGVFANQVRVAANNVLHDEPATDQLAFDVLIQTRHVLLELYNK